MGVQLLQQLIAVHTVDLTGLGNGLAAGSGAAQAVHTDLHKIGSGGLIHIQNIAMMVSRVTCIVLFSSFFLSILKISNMMGFLSVVGVFVVKQTIHIYYTLLLGIFASS